MKRRIAISILGTTLDAGKWDNRWSRWRPTVALCQQPGLFIDRLELIHDNHAQPLSERIVADIGAVSSATEVSSNIINFRDPWDFSEVYTKLRDFARGYNFDPDTEDYLVNITTGTHVAQICWFLLTEARIIPGRLLQLSPPRGGRSNRMLPVRTGSSTSTSPVMTRSPNVLRRSGKMQLLF